MLDETGERLILVFGSILSIFLVAASYLAITGKIGPNESHSGPSGHITEKIWTQEFWQNGELLYPARFCLELNFRDEVCIPESDWNNYSVGEWYK